MAADAAAHPDFTQHASEIVSAYVAHNHVALAEVPNLIRSVHETLMSLGNPASAEAAPEPLKPAVSVRKSVTDEYLVSLEDGKRYQTLKRHLSGLGLTPAEYRAKWGLPSDYPMVAPVYARKRSELAKAMQLGRKRAAPASEAMAAPQPNSDAAAPKRGRAKRTA